MATLNLSKLANELKPYMVPWVRQIATGGGGSGAGGGSVDLVAHVLATTSALGPFHTVSGLTAGQVLRAIDATHASFAQLAHNQLGGIGANDHHNQAHAYDSTDHTGTLSWVKLNFTGSSLGDLATRNYAQLNSRTHDIIGGDHNYTGGAALDVFGLSAASTLAKLTPSADVSAEASGGSLLRSNAGALSVNALTAAGTSAKVRTPLIDTASGDLTLGPVGNVKLTSATRIASDNYASQTTGWGVTYAGGGDFRYLYTDELHAKSFIADLEQALAGGQIISKSVTSLSRNFTNPAAGGATTIYVKDLPSAANMAVFQSGDIIRLRTFNRSGGSLTIADTWGVVTAYADLADGEQSWTFTRSSGAQSGSMTVGTVVNADAIVLDYGTTGNGFYEVNAIDGAYAANSPYAQTVTWATHPATGQVVRTRLGNLRGLFSVADEYGLYAGNGVADADTFIRLSSNTNRLNNLPLEWWAGGTKLAWINATDGITINVATASDPKRALSFSDAGTNIGGALAYSSSTLRRLELMLSDTSATRTTEVWVQATNTAASGAGKSQVLVRAGYYNAASLSLTSFNGPTGASSAYLNADLVGLYGLIAVQVPGGIGANPFLYLVADPDTGIWTNTADQIGFRAGGTGILNVKTTGVDIIGTMAATGAVSGTTGTFTNAVLDVLSGTYRGLSMLALPSNPWAYGLTYRNSVDTLLGSWAAFGASDALTYLYAGVNYGDYTLRVDVTNYRVGIGANITPTNTLSVGGAADFAGNVTVSYATNPSVIVTDTTNSVSGRIQATDTAFQLGSNSNHNMGFFVNNVNKATLATSGKLSLVGASDNIPLDVAGAIQLGDGTAAKYLAKDDIVLANAASMTIHTTSYQSMILIFNVTDVTCALISIRKSTAPTLLVADANFAITDSASNTCVFVSGSNVVLKNNRGGSRTYRLHQWFPG